jgi:TolB-like protein
MAAAGDEPSVTPGEARLELSSILASPDFAASRQLSSFLEYIVDEFLAGRAGNLKERTVALRALGRDDSFDPRLDCIVRVVAGKLRRSLERYYALQGCDHALRIDVPKGSYTPVFRRHDETLRLHSMSPAGEPHDSHGHGDAVNGHARPIVAVVPLKLLTGGPKERFLASLLADDVAMRLGKLAGLKVIDCLAMPSPWGHASDLCKTALRMHANFVFGGTVSRVADRVRLTVRLVDGPSGLLAWGDQYDRPIDAGPLEQQDDIADRIVTNVGRYFRL